MRVRVSVLKFTVEVSGKGSAFSVTDSSAMARVDVASLIKTGALEFAAQAALPQTVVRKTMLITLRSRSDERRGGVTLIGWALQYRFLPNYELKSGQNYEADYQIGLVEGPPGQ
jgi:hypothetical protein